MRVLLSFLLTLTSSPLFATPVIHVLVSFSMPNHLLQETLTDCAKFQVPATLNGLYENSMAKTASKIMELTQLVPNLQMQIDPTLFERFNIEQVPALIVEEGSCFDVIYGHLPLFEGLSRIARLGACGYRVPQDLGGKP